MKYFVPLLLCVFALTCRPTSQAEAKTSALEPIFVLDTIPAIPVPHGLMPVAVIVVYAEGESREIVVANTVFEAQFFQSDCDVLLYLGERWQSFCSEKEIAEIKWRQRQFEIERESDYFPKKL